MPAQKPRKPTRREKPAPRTSSRDAKPAPILEPRLAVVTLGVRDAKLEDLPAIVSIYNATVPSRMVTADTEPVSVESRKAWLREHCATRPLWVVESNGTIAAWLSFSSFYGRPAYAATAEISVYVDALHRRHGIGRQLVSHAIECAPALGVTTLLGFIFGHNTPSLRLFEAHGFTRWGTLPQVALLDDFESDLVIVGRRV
jgi:L-amino acid N-acyltransferase YncA